MIQLYLNGDIEIALSSLFDRKYYYILISFFFFFFRNIRYLILQINLSIKIFSEEICTLKFSGRYGIYHRY